MDIPTIREAVALFDDSERLEQAVAELSSHGFDRADLSFLAPDELAQRPFASAHRLADDPSVSRQAVVSDSDVRQARVLGTGMAATVAAFAAAGFTVATGGVLAAVVIAASVAAGGVAAIGTAIGRKLDRDEARSLDEQVARGGVLLWARLKDAAQERDAIAILNRYSTHVSVHEYAADASVRVLSP